MHNISLFYCCGQPLKKYNIVDDDDVDNDNMDDNDNDNHSMSKIILLAE